MDKRYLQANYEARWTVGLTIAYLIFWLLAAYYPDNAQGITGFPHWFELACLCIPILFIFLCWLMVRVIYRNIVLEDDPDVH
ncbi:YhdT family protein [Candidatus Curculioniphilus buchneri]|uniref:YhdT family protein n=1 Tax=Candidatus Curculioniphilus buchneri TaxID=690594 RepID=UPI00376EEE9E